MLIVAAVTSLYPIAIDFSFNAINEKNVKAFNVYPVSYYYIDFSKRNFLFLSNNICRKNI